VIYSFKENKKEVSIKNKIVIGEALKIVFITLSLTSMLYAYIITDYTILNIKANSHISLPILYKITGLWSNHEGSILLWLFLFEVVNFTLILVNDLTTSTVLYKYVRIKELISLFILMFILFTSNPFIFINVYAINGSELNPVLQDIALAIHPPLIYLGYVSTSIGYISTILILIQKKLYNQLYKQIKIGTRIAWIFLTVGIMLGSWWSYHELGWGGWWFWDPVENASLLPWILLTVLIHLLRKTNNTRQILILSIFVFISSLFGVFFVRSGILLSVHSFAVDYSRGLLILSLIVSLFIISTFYLSINVYKVKPNISYTFSSTDNIVVMKAILFYIVFILITIGTVLPTILHYLYSIDISIGVSFYNKALIPLYAILLFLLAILYVYKNNNSRCLNNNIFSIGLLISLIVAILYYHIYEYLLNLLFFSILIYLLFLILKYFITFSRINSIFYAHTGFILFVLGIVISSTWQMESMQLLLPNDFIKIKNLFFYLREINYIEASNYFSMYGNILITGNHLDYTVTFPEKRYYFNKGIYITKSVICSNYFSDVYTVIGDGNTSTGWYTKFFYRPLMSLLWAGSSISVFGIVISLYYHLYHKYNKDALWF